MVEQGDYFERTIAHMIVPFSISKNNVIPGTF